MAYSESLGVLKWQKFIHGFSDESVTSFWLLNCILNMKIYFT